MNHLAEKEKRLAKMLQKNYTRIMLNIVNASWKENPTKLQGYTPFKKKKSQATSWNKNRLLREINMDTPVVSDQ